MKKLGFVFLSFLLVINAYSLKVNKIKVIGNEHTKEGVILEMAKEFLLNKDFSETELNNLARRVEERLNSTTWFYSSKVYVVPTSRGEDYRNIVIEVQEGFLLRFSGGYAYGSFGMDNIFGNGEKLILDLGYNRQQIIFNFRNILPSIYLKGNLGNWNQKFYSNTNYHYKSYYLQFLGANLELGYRFNWDNFFSLATGYSLIFREDYSLIDQSKYITLSFTSDTRDDIFSSSKGFFFNLSFKINQLKYYESSLDSRYYLSLLPNLKIAFRGIIVLQDDSTPYIFKFSLVGIDRVRSLNYPDMIENAKLQFNSELRYRVFDTSLFSIFNISFEPSLFFDCGSIFDSSERTFEELLYAYGIGLRLFFYVPVFLPLRLEIGWDKYGMPSWFFEISEPF